MGTSSIKAALLGEAGVLEDVASLPCPAGHLDTGLFAFDPMALLERVLELLQAWRGRNVQALVFSNQRATVVGLDEVGWPLCCLGWPDTRCQSYLDAAGGVLTPKPFRQRTGLHLSHLYSIGKLLWLRAEHRQVFDRVRRFGMPRASSWNPWATK